MFADEVVGGIAAPLAAKKHLDVNSRSVVKNRLLIISPLLPRTHYLLIWQLRRING